MFAKQNIGCLNVSSPSMVTIFVEMLFLIGCFFLLIWVRLAEAAKQSTVEPRLSGPWLSGLFDYPDFFSEY